MGTSNVQRSTSKGAALSTFDTPSEIRSNHEDEAWDESISPLHHLRGLRSRTQIDPPPESHEASTSFAAATAESIRAISGIFCAPSFPCYTARVTQPTENEPPAEREPARTPAPAASPEAWLADHGDCLYRTALGRVRNPDIAADLVQDTLLAALRTVEKFGARSTERTWLLGILKHKISDHFRKLGRETSFTDLAFFQDEMPEKFDGEDFWHHDERAPCEWNTGGEASLNRAEFLAALQACLGKLPERISAVFLMREMDDEPSPVICETLDVTASNLWVMLHRARMALRHCLESTYFSPEPSPQK